MASCDPNDLLVAARCYNCVPSGAQSSVRTYLLCQWSNSGEIAEERAGETWAKEVVANGGARPSDNSIAAMSTFYEGLESASLLSKMIAVNCIAPDNLVAACTPLIHNYGFNPWTNSGFLPADLDVTGLQGANFKHLKTGVILSAALSGDTEFGVSIYSMTAVNMSTCEVGAVNAGVVMELLCSYGAGTCYFDCWDFGGGRLSAANNAWAGFLSANRISNTDSQVYRANSGTPFASFGFINSSGGTRPTIELYAFANNNAGVPQQYTLRKNSFVAIHHGLTPAECQAFYNLVVALRTQFGGGTV